MLLFRPIWQKGLYPWWKWSERSEDESQTYLDGIRFLRGLLNKPRRIIWFRNTCKNNSLVNGLRFVFLTQKEPVHKSHLLVKPTGRAACACNHRAQFSERCVFLPLFSVTLSSPRLKSSTWNTAYIYILFCDNSGVALASPVDPPLHQS